MVKAVAVSPKKAATKVAVKKVAVKKAPTVQKVVKPVKAEKPAKAVTKQPVVHSIAVPDLTVPMGLAREALALI